MNTKGALDLAINTLVIVIISLVILGGGITLLYQFIGGADEIKGQLDARTQAELERLLITQGQQVALPLHEAKIAAGDSHVFGLGILNVGGIQGKQYLIEIQLKKVVDEQKNDITSSIDTTDIINTWLFYDPGPYTIDEGEQHQEAILVAVPEDAMKGQYIFRVNVKAGLADYGNPQLFTVTVK